jgi:hypothetical protein
MAAKASESERERQRASNGLSDSKREIFVERAKF